MVLWPRVPTDFVDPTDATRFLGSKCTSYAKKKKKKNLEK